MKTFATLALLGLASAIKLRDTGSEEQVEITILAKDVAKRLMDACDANKDGLCTIEEQEEAFSFSWVVEDEMTETELAFIAKLDKIFRNADIYDYDLDSDHDGFVTL